MNIWIKRSLGTIAVTGGIVLAGAAAAQADDIDGQSSSNDSQGSFSAPISIGGLDIGSSSERSSSSTEETTVTDGDRSISETTERSSASSNDSRLSTDGISIDPAAAFSRSSESDRSSTGSGSTGIDGSSSQSEQSASASAPITIGSLDFSQQDARQSDERAERTVVDGDRSSSEVSERSDESQSSTSFGTGSISLDPAALLEGSSSQDSSRLGRDVAEDSSSSASSGAASLPISIEGFTFSREAASASQQAGRSELVDGDRSVVTERSSARADESATSFGGGGLDIAPALSFGTEQAREDSRLGRDLQESSSDSRASVAGSLPIAFDGFSGAFGSSQARADREDVTSVDGDRSSRQVSETASLVERATAFEGGAFSTVPAFGLDTDQQQASDRFGSTRGTTSSSTTNGFLEGPFEGGAFDVTDRSASVTEALRASLVSDGDRSVETVSTDRDERTDARQLGFDGFDGDPRGAFSTSTQRLSDLLRR